MESLLNIFIDGIICFGLVSIINAPYNLLHLGNGETRQQISLV